MKNKFTHASLCSGIGGFDLAARWMGWKNLFHCEIDPFCRKILQYHFPKSISYEDIKKTDFSIHQGQINVLSAGFPCQPFSTAGHRKGAEDDRYLWPQVLRTVQQIQPNWIVLENVVGITNMVFPLSPTSMEIQTDIEGKIHHQELAGEGILLHITKELEAEGYDVQIFVIPACSIGAPHRRDRVWFIANAHGQRREAEGNNRKKGSVLSNQKWADSKNQRPGEPEQPKPSPHGSNGATPNPTGQQLQGGAEVGSSGKIIQDQRQQSSGLFCADWKNFPTQPPLHSGDDGIPQRLDGITFPSLREKSIRGFGNAVVPQVVLEIFTAIQAVERGEGV